MPVELGSASRLGSRKVRTDDGRYFENLDLAAAHYLTARGGTEEIVRSMALDARFQLQTVRVTGLEMANKGVWHTFIAKRKITPNLENLNRIYELQPDEAKELGL